ncbi:TRAP transporter large permease [Pararhodobacter sp.]|uniref:TRAP transporter large permease n=1 Tax=Pararhodobacter sp. TaxID=2127056 RepID=UPI002FDC8486
MIAQYGLPLGMVLVLLLGIFSGYPVAFVLGGTGVLFVLLTDLPNLFLGTMVSRVYGGVIANWLLVAVPMFVYMGLMLERSGLARNLLISLQYMMGGMRGGLALAVALLGLILAAGTGVIGASVVTLGILGLPVMLQNGYNKEIATGTIAASGTLGILLPPSIMLVLMGDILSIPVGDLFVAAVLPGVLLVGLYMIFLITVAIFRGDLMPAMAVTEKLTRLQMFIRMMRDMVAPIALVMVVLGSIIAGLATPTEAASLGAIGATILAATTRQLSWKVLGGTIFETGKITGMIMFVIIGATCFGVVFARLGGPHMIASMVDAMPFEAWGTLIMLLAIIFVLGFVLEWIEISYVVLPLFAPIVIALDFGLGLSTTEIMLWFAILVAVVLQTSFLTPPFGYALFYLKGVSPKGVTMAMIYRGAAPFVVLQLAAVGLLMLFPALAIWLPRLAFAN